MAEQDSLIVYGHEACPMLPPVIGALKQAKVPYAYVNIHQDAAARRRVQEINHGMESVPTLVFPDGATLTEPNSTELGRALRERGYHFGPVTWVISNAWILLTAVILIVALLRLLGVF